MSKPRELIRIGFMPLLDSAIPVIAARCGFGLRHGLEIELVRETSWANVRDRLAIGHFDAAHLLAPLPIANALGLMPFDVPLVAPMTLGHGGNAITVSRDLWQQMRASWPGLVTNDPASVGVAVAAVVRARRAAGAPQLTFAVVHPYSSHNYELRHWLAGSGIDPDQDIAIAIVAPPYMPDALGAGRIDGFCVGEPWNSVAAQSGAGAIVLTKAAIWPHSPDKVLALRSDWAAANADLASRLLKAMHDSAQWCADPAHLDMLIGIMSGHDVLGVAPDAVRPALTGIIPFADTAKEVPGFLSFAGEGALAFRLADARWYLDQMVRWRQVTRQAAQGCTLGDLLAPAALPPENAALPQK